MVDAEVLHFGQIGLQEPNGLWLSRLINEINWRSESITLWGKTMLQPRLIAWFADAGCAYRYSNILLEATPWPPLVMALRSAVEQVCGHSFNSVLLNYYRNEQDSMGFHSDDEPELGPKPVIASLSFGATREFVFKHKTRKDVKPYKIPLVAGTLLVMRSDTQTHWQHGIAKSRRPCGARVNLTFRTIRQSGSESGRT
jgi:alkylated DNA repair dioxygenase AlkB